MNQDIALYKELITFCESHLDEIETSFQRHHTFDAINEECYLKMFVEQRRTLTPIEPKVFKEQITGLTKLYSEKSKYYLQPRNSYRKTYDIQLGQWYEKALCLFFGSKGIAVKKRGFPLPDYEVSRDGKPIAYYELKFIEAPFITAKTSIKDTYPYETPRFDYEASLTLDTGAKMMAQRERIESDLIAKGYPVHFVWWFDCFHIKGVFAMSAQEVFDYHDHLSGDLHQRKQRAGDQEDHQETGKIYPPLLEMITFSELMSIYQNA